MLAAQVSQLLQVLFAAVDGLKTPWVKGAATGWVDRTGYVSLQNDPLPGAIHHRIRYRDEIWIPALARSGYVTMPSLVVLDTAPYGLPGTAAAFSLLSLSR